MDFKDDKGRLTDMGVIQIHRLRNAYARDRTPQAASRIWTLQVLAEELGVSLGTVHNVCRGRTHLSLHPSKDRYWNELHKLEFLEASGK